MKLFIVFNYQCYNDITKYYRSLEDAKNHYDNKTVIVEAPDYVFEGWGYDESKTFNDRFIKPVAPDGWLYDDDTGTFYKELSNREKRKEFYTTGKCMKEKNEFFIDLEGEKFSVDSATKLGCSYEYRGEIDKSNELKELIKLTVKEIREKYPD